MRSAFADRIETGQRHLEKGALKCEHRDRVGFVLPLGLHKAGHILINGHDDTPAFLPYMTSTAEHEDVVHH